MVLSGSQVEGAESRFAHILQPIKDLTKNWDVDIAAYLEDYLEELEHTTISFDGGLTTMNFAQAAMLVQSTACVYSKKVEYLYSLVYQVLDLLANKKKQAQKASVDDEGNDADADFHEDEDGDEFLSLDDLPEGKNLNMKEDFGTGEEFQLLPEIPLCLIPLEEGEKGENPLLSKKGEVLASRNDFKMNTCSIHTQGTLLLDMSYLKLLEESLKILAKLKEKMPAEHITPDTEMRNINEVSGTDTPQDLSDDIFDGGDNMEDEVDGSLPLANMSDHQQMETSQVEVQRNALRRSERQRKPVNAAVLKPAVDPWKQLEPHEEGISGKTLSKKSTSYRLCPGLEDKTKKRKRKNEKQVPKMEPLSKYIVNACFSHGSKFPKNTLKVPSFLHLERQYWQEFKRRQVLHKEQLKQHKEEFVQENEEADDEEGGVSDDMQPIAGLEGNDDDDLEPLVDDNLFNAIDAGMRSNQSFSNNIQERSLADRMDDSIVINSYEDLVRKHVEEYMASAQEYAQITELSKRVAEWEDKVVPRLEEEDTHEPFDINKYGTGVLDNLLRGRTVQFHKLVQGKPVFEICRTFLASLMLANTTNVRIEEKGVLEKGMDQFELELLSTKRHFEELQEYQAPSLT